MSDPVKAAKAENAALPAIEGRLSPKAKAMLLVVPLIVALDQATKIWIVRNLRYGRDEIDLIPGFLSLVHAQNPGAAFGMLTSFEYRMHVFLLFTLIALGVIGSMYRQTPRSDWFQSAVLGLLTAGAIGNFIDRVHKQTVTDFVHVYWDREPARSWLIDVFGTYHYPSFNVADASICVGIGIFLLWVVFLDDSDDADSDRIADEIASEAPPVSADA
jgi:signal peptidase II